MTNISSEILVVVYLSPSSPISLFPRARSHPNKNTKNGFFFWLTGITGKKNCFWCSYFFFLVIGNNGKKQTLF